MASLIRNREMLTVPGLDWGLAPREMLIAYVG